MKIPFKKTSALLLFSALCFSILRFLQLFFCVDSSSGFFKTGYSAAATEISIVIFIFMLFSIIFGCFEKKVPKSYPKTTLSLAIGYLLLGLFLIADIIFFPNSIPYPLWQKIILYFVGFLSVIIFFLLGVSRFITIPNFENLPFDLFCLAPFVYWILRTFIYFSFYTSIATLSENVFFIIGFLSVMFLLLYLVFQINSHEQVKTQKGLLPLFIFAILSSVNCSVAQMAFVIMNRRFLLHELSVNNFTFFGILIFLIILYFNMFSEDNLKERVRKHKKKFELYKH